MKGLWSANKEDSKLLSLSGLSYAFPEKKQLGLRDFWNQPTGAPGHVFALKISCSLLCHAPSWHILLRNAAPWAYHDRMTILQVNSWDSKWSSFNWIFWGDATINKGVITHHDSPFSHPKVHPKPQNNQDWWCLKKPLDGPHSPTVWKTVWPIFIETLQQKYYSRNFNEMVQAIHLPNAFAHTNCITIKNQGSDFRHLKWISLMTWCDLIASHLEQLATWNCTHLRPNGAAPRKFPWETPEPTLTVRWSNEEMLNTNYIDYNTMWFEILRH